MRAGPAPRNAELGGCAGEEVAGAKHFKIALDLWVEPRPVNERVPGAVGLHFIDRKRVKDDVLGQPLHVLRIVGRESLPGVNVEPGMRPAVQDRNGFRQQEPIPRQKRDDPCAEKYIQRCEDHVGNDLKKPAVYKEPVGCERVKVRVEAEELDVRKNFLFAQK